MCLAIPAKIVELLPGRRESRAGGSGGRAPPHRYRMKFVDEFRDAA
jgi:hypothetical protein